MNRIVLKSVVLVAAVVLGGLAQSAQAGIEFLVASQAEGNKIVRFDYEAGPLGGGQPRLLPDFADLTVNSGYYPGDLQIGPDGNVYVAVAENAGGATGKVMR